MTEFGCIEEVLENRYKITKFINEGMQGKIYEIEDDKNETLVLKIIESKNKTDMKSLIYCYKTASDYKFSPKIYNIKRCKIGDIYYTYIIMKLIKGVSLKNFEYLDEKLFINSLNLYWKLFLDHSIQHLDYKPDNFLYNFDKLFIIDFDSAKIANPTLYSIKKYNHLSAVAILHYIRKYKNYIELREILFKYYEKLKNKYKEEIINSISFYLQFEKVKKINELIDLINENMIHIHVIKKYTQNYNPDHYLEMKYSYLKTSTSLLYQIIHEYGFQNQKTILTLSEVKKEILEFIANYKISNNYKTHIRIWYFIDKILYDEIFYLDDIFSN
jgi:predicted Ser/Thr protein kinase